VLGVFWTSFGAVVLFFTALSVVLDLCERLARFLRNWSALKEAGHQAGWLIVEFYASFVPFIWLKILPICVPMAAAIALARLSRRNEVVPLVTAGVSTRRIVLPIVLSGFVIAGLIVAVREAAAPRLGRVQMTLGRLLTKLDPDRIKRIPHFQDPGGARLSADAYLPLVPGLEGAMVTVRDATGSLTDVLWYPRLEWDGGEERWVAPRGGTRFALAPDRAGERTPIPEGAIAPLETGITLLEISITERGALALSLEESATLARAAPHDPKVVWMHEDQWTLPLSAVVLLLLALPFGIHFSRRTAWPALAAVVVASALYFAAQFLARGVWGSGEVNLAVVAWAPTVLFGSLGLALLATMES
jgi:lipopolysaccharide export system permease protein